MKKRIIAGLLASTLAVSTGVMGCSQKSEVSDVIQLGATFTLTGNLSASGEYCQQGLELFLEDVEKMDVLGKKVEVVVEDCGSDQQGSINATNKLLARENISAWFGCGNTSADALASAPSILESEVPCFVFGSSANIYKENNPYMLLNRMSDDHAGALFAKSVAEILKMKNPAIIHVSEAYGTSLSSEIITNLKTYGITPAIVVSYNVDEKQFTPILTQVLNSGCDGIIAVSHNFDAAVLAKTVQSMNIDLPLIGSASYCSVISIDAAGDAMDGWYSIGDWSPNAINEKGAEFSARFQERFGTKPDKAAVITYDSLMLMCEAIKLQGASDPASVLEGIKKIKDYDGVMCKYTWHEDRSLANSQPLVRVENGEVEVIEIVNR
ncbi:ABC transporter substrate-binding protein [Lacrimispora celerecrescens]|uniref:Leucine-binding protein domain-containing protein n=1 Tax=Lacrimispora celerecrescens TaxID=29354 RepID=A0A084JL83_9FIRM|nr:ABC transporter substrate-binding protein [Lacrimispora celerecrescens]KEZ89717.1 hypothetical protein IO98_13630 [Lacrimispora celerecrescens]